jgi:hypothetical protein
MYRSHQSAMLFQRKADMGEHVAAGNGWILSRHQLQLDALQSHTNGTMGRCFVTRWVVLLATGPETSAPRLTSWAWITQ